MAKTKSNPDCEATYTISNESLQAIVEGLNINPNDAVLAIAGSGDQPFALLELADRVTAVDVEPNQIALIRRRARMLKRGHYDEIFQVSFGEIDDIKAARDKYFSKEGRLERISAKLRKLDILEPMDISEAAENFPAETFNKVYVSNALSTEYKTYDQIESILTRLAELIPPRGLIYSSTYIRFPPASLLKVNFELSERAQKLESEYTRGPFYRWRPTVLERE